jgi:hypothetical protein
VRKRFLSASPKHPRLSRRRQTIALAQPVDDPSSSAGGSSISSNSEGSSTFGVEIRPRLAGVSPIPRRSAS